MKSSSTPKSKTASWKPHVEFSEPEWQRGRHAPAPIFDLADLVAQDFDVRWRPPGLDGTLGLASCALFVLHAVSRVKSRHLRSVGYFSRAPTYQRLPLTSDQFYRTTTLGNQEAPAEVGCLTDAKQARRPSRGFFCGFSGRHCGHKIRITGANSAILAGSIVGWQALREV
jgi:hypothetical protein